MSEPIKESKEKKSAREKGMEAWAASIEARKRQAAAPPPLQENEPAAGSSRADTSQRPKKIKTVTENQKTHNAQKHDSVDLTRSAEKSEGELTMKDLQNLAKGRRAGTTPQVNTPPTPVQAQVQTPEKTVEKSIERAVTAEVAEQAETVTADEIQSSPAVVTTVAAKASKKTGKTEKADATEKPSPLDDLSEEELAELVKPGNSPKASAYVRAGDFSTEGSTDPDIDDYVLAL